MSIYASSKPAPAGPAIRRMIVDEAARVSVARTQRDRQASYAAMYAYSCALRAVLDNHDEPDGIAERVGTTGDNKAVLAEVARFLGETTARELGLT